MCTAATCPENTERGSPKCPADHKLSDTHRDFASRKRKAQLHNLGDTSSKSSCMGHAKNITKPTSKV